MRKYNGNLNGERYCGDIIRNEVHNLLKEKSMCQIDEKIKAGQEKPFNSLIQAHQEGYSDCVWDIRSS